MHSLRAIRPVGLARQIGRSAAAGQVHLPAHGARASSTLLSASGAWQCVAHGKLTVRGLSRQTNQITERPGPLGHLGSKQQASGFSALSRHSKVTTQPFVFTTRNLTLTSAGQRAHPKRHMAHYEITVGDSPSKASSVTSMTSVGSTVSARGMSTGREKGESEADLEKGESGSDLESGKTAQGSADGKKQSRFRVLMQQYGRVAIAVYLLVSAVDLTLCVWGVWLGGDSLVYTINAYLGQYITRLQKAAQRMEEGEAGGADKWATILLVGYAVHKCLTPLRLAVTAAILPWSARTVQRLGWTWLIPKSAPTITKKPMAKAADAIRQKLK